MIYKGSCHCGQIAFEVEGEIEQLIDCNCSICARKGSLLWFVPRDKLTLLSDDSQASDYTFGSASVHHRFCPRCGMHPYGEGTDPHGHRMAAVNARCLEDVDISAIPVHHFDGKSL